MTLAGGAMHKGNVPFPFIGGSLRKRNDALYKRNGLLCVRDGPGAKHKRPSRFCGGG